ncbi:T9SS type A sorting domain-containing protein, partial [Flavobacteriales bacterium]|nr:T9SS type A sorting domain-containing protein [Flavobacteriales bacterium]
DVENFESGWGIWNDGGSDCRRNRRDRNYANGTYCVRIRDNTSTSVTYTDDLDLSGYEELTVGFGFVANSMENGEDFVLEYSTNGGNSFTTVATYIRGVNFSNGLAYSDEVVIPGPFSGNTVIQFRCDASGNNDQIFLDDVAISGCTSGGRWSSPVTPLIEADLSANPSPFGMLNLYPNPANDAIQLDFVLYEDVRYDWMITDMQGRVLTKAMGEGLRGEQQLRIEVSGWPEGTYLLFLRSTNGAHTKRFMIQR